MLNEEGGLLLRLSSTSEPEGQAWVDALRASLDGSCSTEKDSHGFFGNEPPASPLEMAASKPLRKSPS